MRTFGTEKADGLQRDMTLTGARNADGGHAMPGAKANEAEKHPVKTQAQTSIKILVVITVYRVKPT